MIKKIIFCLTFIPAFICAADDNDDIQPLDTNPTLPEYSDVAHVDWKQEFYLRASHYTKPIQVVADDSIRAALFLPDSDFNQAMETVVEAAKTNSLTIHQSEQLVDAAAWGRARNVNSPLSAHLQVILLPCVWLLPLLSSYQNPDIICDSLITISSIFIVLACINYQTERVKNRRRDMLYQGLRATIKGFDDQIQKSRQRSSDKFYKQRYR